MKKWFKSLMEDDKSEQLINNRIKSQPLHFEKSARYRCSQENYTSVRDNITFSSKVETEYLLSIASGRRDVYHVLLKDFIYLINPNGMGGALDYTKELEYIRNDVKFTQNDFGQITDILNLAGIRKKWDHFKNNEMEKLEFHKALSNKDPKIAGEMVSFIESEFSSQNNFSTLMEKNLFYHVLLKSNIMDKIGDFTIKQLSQLFPEQFLKIDVKYFIETKDELTTVKLIGNLDEAFLDMDKIHELYQQLYLPMIRFKFSAIEFDYKAKYTFSNKSKLLESATVSMKEKIKNNFESTVIFDLKKVEL